MECWVASSTETTSCCAPSIQSCCNALESGHEQSDQADPGALPTGPIVHPYVSQDATLSLVANRAMMISLLFDPKSAIYLSSEILPRKRLVLDPERIADSLGKLAPPFAVGPLLLDPQHVSVPLCEVAEGTRIWRRKVGNSFPPATDLEALTKDVGLFEQRAVIEEGWLGLRYVDFQFPTAWTLITDRRHGRGTTDTPGPTAQRPAPPSPGSSASCTVLCRPLRQSVR